MRFLRRSGHSFDRHASPLYPGAVQELRAFWPAFYRAARSSPWRTALGLLLAVFSLFGGTIFWLQGLPSVAAVALFVLASTVAALVTYHAASVAWRTADGEITYLKGIIVGNLEHRQKQETHAKLIDEGIALMEAILEGGDDQLSRRRADAESWRERARDFLAEHSYNGPADASSFYAAFNKSVANFQYKGGNYSGDRAVLASQVDHATACLQGMSILEKSYLDYHDLSAYREGRGDSR